MSSSFDILIIGGGIVGLSAALAMSKRNYTVALFDAGPLKIDIGQQDLRVYAINQASRELFESLGVWEMIQETRYSPYHHMHVWDASNGAHIDFDSRMLAHSQLGAIIEESVIKHALLQQINAQKSIHLFPGQAVDSILTQNDTVKISSGNTHWEGRLLMISDGAKSPAREQLKVPLTQWSYQQQAIVAQVEIEKSHQKTAWQVFNADGPLAFLPLHDEHQCSIVWSTTPERANALMASSVDDFNQELNKAFSEKLGQIKLCSSRHDFPLTMRHAKQYSGSNWLLLGDAAHTIHPLAGLGLNTGLADVNSWLHYLSLSKQKFSFEKALSAYQRHRKTEVWKIILLMDGLKNLFTSNFPPIKALRGMGLTCFNHLTPIKRLLVHQAMGMNQDHMK